MQKEKIWRREWFWLLIAAMIYLAMRLFALIKLPVFADEAIYIRWAQLIISDPTQYLFFPLNDGKTPLQMWLMIPFLMIVKDPLWAARFLSVIVGLIQMLVLYLIIGEISYADKKWIKFAQKISLLFSLIIPFWFFHQRMALTDALLSLCFSLMIWLSLKALKNEKLISGWLMGAMMATGAAFYSKLPAILFFPTLFLLAWHKPQKKISAYWQPIIRIMMIMFGGLLVFITLRISPAFGQLFNRGGDFLLPISEMSELGIGGLFKNLGVHLCEVASIINHYVGWGALLVIPLAAVLNKSNRRNYILMSLATLSYILPIALLGKVVYPRYYLPFTLPLVIMTILAISDLIQVIFSGKQNRMRLKIAVITLIIVSINLISTAIFFIWPAWTNPAKINFIPADKEQYLYEWSSGDGIKETVNFIKEKTQNKTALILTEGYFGTLPDALLMYFFNQNVKNIFIEGIGQPVIDIPIKMQQKMVDYDQTFLIVNSHRMKLDLPPENLRAQFCRSGVDTPCLQIWEINDSYTFQK